MIVNIERSLAASRLDERLDFMTENVDLAPAQTPADLQTLPQFNTQSLALALAVALLSNRTLTLSRLTNGSG